MPSGFTVEDLLLDDDFIKYCLQPDGELRQKWERLVHENKVDRETMLEAKALVALLSPVLNEAEIGEEVNGLREAITEKETKVPEKAGTPWLKLLAPTAVIAVISVISYFAWQPAKKAVETMAAFSTKTGEQKKIVLPDGTSVILNSNTRLTYDKSFNTATRTVFLRGKAFFDVAKNPDKPFSVNSDRFSTTALGTAFYVVSDSSGNYSVKLLEGKVRINESNLKETAYLTAGEEVQWKTSKKNFEKSTYDTAYLSNWVSGRIVFRKTPVREAIETLKKWYGVDILLSAPDHDGISINGTYQNVSLEDILKVICFSLNCEILYEDDRIIIR